MPKRGDRAAPPPARDEWDLVFADNGAAKGWEQLAAQAPGPLREAWLILRSDPREGAPRNRMHRLKADLKSRVVAGISYEQWQYEVTGGGRIWYGIDDPRHTLQITHAGTGHPARTD
ncbi:MAG: hypothetical protein ACRDZO_02750 [Egibacteraceae bacterium]